VNPKLNLNLNPPTFKSSGSSAKRSALGQRQNAHHISDLLGRQAVCHFPVGEQILGHLGASGWKAAA